MFHIKDLINRSEFIRKLNDKFSNINLSWGNIEGKPELFPPEEHTHDVVTTIANSPDSGFLSKNIFNYGKDYMMKKYFNFFSSYQSSVFNNTSIPVSTPDIYYITIDPFINNVVTIEIANKTLSDVNLGINFALCGKGFDLNSTNTKNIDKLLLEQGILYCKIYFKVILLKDTLSLFPNIFLQDTAKDFILNRNCTISMPYNEYVSFGETSKYIARGDTETLMLMQKGKFDTLYNFNEITIETICMYSPKNANTRINILHVS